MGRAKKVIKAKEPVRLRFNKLKNGNSSIYLDIYHNGKRSYEFLKLYLIPETDITAKIQNENTLVQANAIKAERILDLTNQIAGITDKSYKAKIPFIEWMNIYYKYVETHAAKSTLRWVKLVIKELEKYNAKVSLGEVDREYINGFMNYLLQKKSRNGKDEPLNKKTVFVYLSYVRSSLNYAVKENILHSNPFVGVKENSLGKTESKREYLTVDEVKRLIATPCKKEILKRAFLFSCFCGLRISDVKALCWKHIRKSAERWQVEIQQYKTKKILYLPLNLNARKWLPEQGNALPDAPVFPSIGSNHVGALSEWAKKADITKEVCFHTSRHTFATLALTAGIDIYTTSQLLGHTTVYHTQIYAKIINSKKNQAISLLDSAFK